MSLFCFSLCCSIRLFVVGVFFAAALCFAHAQNAGATVGPGAGLGSIGGIVADPTGAVIPQAAVIATRAGHAPVKTTSDGVGHFLLKGLASGVYVVEAQETNFHPTRTEGVRVAAGATVTLTMTLAIEADQQSVTVSADTLDASPEKNGGAIVLKGEDLRALSDDPDELSTQLQGMAGADAETGTQFYVDGFTASRLPPKSAIREIRINQNPYSAQYDSLGFGRIEILTKPGADKLHAEYWMQGNNSPWNAQNPFVTEQPPYYMYQFDSDVNGPLGKNASYFFSIWHRQAINVSVVNAEILDDTTRLLPSRLRRRSQLPAPGFL